MCIRILKRFFVIAQRILLYMKLWIWFLKWKFKVCVEKKVYLFFFLMENVCVHFDSSRLPDLCARNSYCVFSSLSRKENGFKCDDIYNDLNYKLFYHFHYWFHISVFLSKKNWNIFFSVLNLNNFINYFHGTNLFLNINSQSIIFFL